MRPTLRADLLLLLAAFFWGTTFVPQRLATEHLSTFAYNAARFALGALVVLPFALRGGGAWGREVMIGAWTGFALFAASGFQQEGLVTTTAGNAGFLTGLYVILVPLAGRLAGRRLSGWVWAGVVLALAGTWLLSVPREGLHQFVRGDALVLVGAFCWTIQILSLDRLAPGQNPYRISVAQNLVCAALSAAAAAWTGTGNYAGLAPAWISVLYAGVFSAGLAFTLQVCAQRDAPPAHAAILMSLEAVFAAAAGAWLLGEPVTSRTVVGSILMLAGMLAAQADSFRPTPADVPRGP